jgi:copper chaperone NosL
VNSPRLTGAVAIMTGAILYACSPEPAAPVVPLDVSSGQACALDGMLVGYHDGPKAQVLRKNGERAFYCDAREVFGEWLDPVRRRHIVDVWFQTLDNAPWEAHADGWDRAQNLYFVAGSRRMAAMGPTLAPFREAAAARYFVDRYGGSIYRFDEIDATLMRQLRRQGIDHLTN